MRAWVCYVLVGMGMRCFNCSIVTDYYCLLRPSLPATMHSLCGVGGHEVGVETEQECRAERRQGRADDSHGVIDAYKTTQRVTYWMPTRQHSASRNICLQDNTARHVIDAYKKTERVT